MRRVSLFHRPAAWVSAACGFALTAAILTVTGTTGTPAAAQGLVNHNSNAPVDVAADSIELQSRADRVVIAGNVNIDQAGLRMSAARVTVAYSNTNRVQINRIDATGGVTVVKGTDRATGSSAIYDLDRRLITMIGNVQLTQGVNHLSGGRMVIDLSTGRATVDGRSSGGSTTPGQPATGAAGRVTGRFTVPQRN